nr:DUF4105 domain-containing protein [Bacteroidota bacterium]
MPLSDERVHRNLTDFQGIIKPTGFNGLITISGLGLLPALLTLLKSFPGNHIHFLLSIFLLWSPAIFSKTLSDDARISILTCGPGKPLYATFGHSAIRVHDPVNSIDDVYNFGTYDFNTKNFYLKFLTGSLDYSLTVSSFSGFVNAYISENRWVYEQQ